MSLNILLVFPEAQAELAKEIRNMLEDLPMIKEAESDIITRKNVDSARECLEERHQRFDLIIVHLYLPPDLQSPLDPSNPLGLALLQELNKSKQRIPSILVAPAKNEPLSLEVKKLGNTDLILEGANFEEELRLYVLQKLKTTYQEPAAKTVHTVAEPKQKQDKVFGNVDICLDLDSQRYSPNHCAGRFDMNIYRPGTMPELIGSGPLWLDWSTLNKLAKKSRELEDIAKYPGTCWREELEEIGGSLRKEICEKEENFKKSFSSLLKEVENNIQNTRIRFKLSWAPKEDEDPRTQYSADLQAVVLEALLDDQKKFLMLQAPIVRRLDASVDEKYKKPLYYGENGEKPLRCLIIEADARGKVELDNGKEVELGKLGHIQEECQEVEKYLQEHLQEHHEVRRLSKDLLPENLLFQDWVTRTLEEDGPWDLVHYAGHSKYVKENRTGYVFFPGLQEVGKEVVAVQIDQFSMHLRTARVRFVYVSSCQSSEDDFVFQMANNMIPAILGFRWRIDDEEAKEYAVKFYQCLLEYHSLEQAFLEARQYVHKVYEDNRIWVSPLLVLQTS